MPVSRCGPIPVPWRGSQDHECRSFPSCRYRTRGRRGLDGDYAPRPAKRSEARRQRAASCGIPCFCLQSRQSSVDVGLPCRELHERGRCLFLQREDTDAPRGVLHHLTEIWFLDVVLLGYEGHCLMRSSAVMGSTIVLLSESPLM